MHLKMFGNKAKKILTTTTSNNTTTRMIQLYRQKQFPEVKDLLALRVLLLFGAGNLLVLCFKLTNSMQILTNSPLTPNLTQTLTPTLQFSV